MPQLSIETFVTQYFWLVVILFVFYYISAAIIIPQISAIIKTRNKLSVVPSSKDLSESSNTILGKSILSQALSIKSSSIPSTANFSTVFKKVNKNWIKKFKRTSKKTVKKNK